MTSLQKFLVVASLPGCCIAGSVSSGTAAQSQPAEAYVVASDGNEVRYRIREQLARVEMPNDAVGTTKQVYGRLALTRDNRLIAAESGFVVNVGDLKSDRQFRDRYVRSRTLETTKFPTVEFRPTSLRGLPRAIPRTGSHTFEVLGNLTVKGVTRPGIWKVTATARASEVTGTAMTAFTFADFGLSQPRVPIVVSVADTIQLEYDFKLIPKK